MWCPACKADVAAELSADNRRMVCARCQTELGIAASAALQSSVSSATDGMERDARALLARWSTQNVIEAPSIRSSAFGTPNLPGEAQSLAGRISIDPERTNVAATRVTDEKPARSAITSSTLAAFTEFEERAAPTQSQPMHDHPEPTERKSEPAIFSSPDLKSIPQRHPSGHGYSNDVSHHAHHESTHHPQPPRSSVSAVVGQILAYLGVVVLTGGVVMAVFSFFGGPENMMPIGLLTAAGGQMVLFLGVVTLVSAGIERAASETIWRIDYLAEEVHHMGLAIEHVDQDHNDIERQQSQRHQIPTSRAA